MLCGFGENSLYGPPCCPKLRSIAEDRGVSWDDRFNTRSG